MARGRPMTKEYICYKGEDFVMIGTAREISEQTGVSLKYLYWLAYTKRARLNTNSGARGGWVIRLLEEDEDETAEY